LHRERFPPHQERQILQLFQARAEPPQTGLIDEEMASLTSSHRMEMDSRVRDYLDDKLQTPADFAGLDALLQQARNQQKLLKEQV
jgi:hypothetical protein